MVDANQNGSVRRAIAATAALPKFDPFWVEEPTSPDDVLGHAAIARAVAPIADRNRRTRRESRDVQTAAAGRSDRLLSNPPRRPVGVRGNDTLATMLLAAKFGVPVCPHAGGVGLCELVQHLAIFDYIAVGASLDNRVLEFVDHLHEHFVDPVRIERARYVAPLAPGFSSAMHAQSIAAYTFADGSAWRAETPAFADNSARASR